MRREYLSAAVLMIGSACAFASTPATDAARQVPAEYRHRLIQQLSVADDKAAAWIDALEQAPENRRTALAFLLANMPAADLKSLSPDRVRQEIDLAYEARAATPWAAAVPDDIFLNDVLPYAQTSEARNPWREQFRKQFAPLVADAKSAGEAARRLNRSVFKTLNVAYHATKRRVPDQSPTESAAIGFASCTGLSIILADACRSVGLPARVVGTAAWSDDSGNHTWVEIWDNGWHFVGAAEPGPLDDTWFKDNAAKANAGDPKHAIYAASFRQTATKFPAVWAEERSDLYAENVTARYSKRPPTTGPATAPAPAATPLNYACGRSTGPITIDGRGDDAAWQAAPWTADFVDIQGGSRPAPRFRTRVKMLWDDANLYVYAQIEEPHVWATIREKNKVIFQDNDFELFIDPDGDGLMYHEFEVNAHNTIWELTLPKPYRDGGKPIDPDNVPGLRSAVHVDGTPNDARDTDRGWGVEIAIPFAGLKPYAGTQALPPRDGDAWRMNFSRVEWLIDVINGGYRRLAKADRDEDNWVWSPQNVIDMHRPEMWGIVTFETAAKK